MPISFVHLRLHTEYSLNDSLIRIENLVKTAKQQQLPALALTDHMNLFAAIKFYQAMRPAGIKPILGAEVSFINEEHPDQPFRCALLCQHFQGYQQLMMLISRAYLDPQRANKPLISLSWLSKESTEGLIALSGGINGNIGQALLQGRSGLAAQRLQTWNRLFPNRFYIELSRTHRPQEDQYIPAACELAHTHQTPVIATNDVVFLSSSDFEAHEARVCIQQGNTLNDPKRARLYSRTQYLRSSKEMVALFSDIPSALSNTVEIAKRCNLSMPLGDIHLPQFPTPSGITPENHLIQEAYLGLTKHLDKNNKSRSELLPTYQPRLDSELQVINAMGFASYFLIVADFIRWAKKEGIPVGPGRGSGAGSLVAFALQITDLDPITYQLLFERFLNAERVSLPDFDIDFCMIGRDKVIAYVMERYGAHAVAQIITFGTMAAKAVVRDVGRVLGYPYGMVDTIAKLVPFEPGMTLDKALSQSNSKTGLQARYEQEEEVRTLIDLARQLEGLVRNAGTHAGGIVIAPKSLTHFTALFREADATHTVTQYDKDDIETVGLVKFDFLGLRTLTIIHWAVDSINQRRLLQSKPALDLTELPLDDPNTFALLRRGQVTAIFQLESRGIRSLLKRLAPTHFDDIVALLALFRPGPLQSGMVDDFINRKHQGLNIPYPHPWLVPILKPTYGIILYQEQVMQIAQVLAGYTLGAADLLRRAMGKKKPAEMAKQRAFFIQGAQKKGVEQTLANAMFNLVEKFAGYGFNKSHSAAYALISWQTAWLKTHYPAEFMAAVLSSEMERTEKLASFIYECYALGLIILPPHIHESDYYFTVNEQGQIRYGLGAIKGLGRSAIEHIMQLKIQGGPFQNLLDLCHRLDLKYRSRRILEALIYSGTLDIFTLDRGVLASELDFTMQSATQQLAAQLSAQADLFGHSPQSPEEKQTSKHWTPRDYWQKEKEALGLYLTTHPLSQYQSELSHFRLTALKADLPAGQLLLAGWLTAYRVILTTRGDRFAVLLLEDTKHRLEIKLSQEYYQASQDYLNKDNLLLLEVLSTQDSQTQEMRLTVQKILDITQARQIWSKGIVIRLEKKEPSLLDDLQKLLISRKGSSPVIIEYDTLTKLRIMLGIQWRVIPSDECLAKLREYFGEGNVWIDYFKP